MRVRRATEADIPEFLRLKLHIMTDHYPMPVSLADEPDWPQHAASVMRDLMASPDQGFFVADGDDGRLAGTISVGVERHIPGIGWAGIEAYVGDMCVEEAYRGRGLGTALMRTGLDFARTRGATYVHLYATPGAIGMYERFGFTPRSSETDLFPVLVADLDEVELRLTT